MSVRISGLLADRPAANAAAGARYYATDGVIYFSTGDGWKPSFALDHRDAGGVLSGLLAVRPDPSTCVGWIWIDEDGNEYEAFPRAWALVNQIETF